MGVELEYNESIIGVELEYNGSRMGRGKTCFARTKKECATRGSSKTFRVISKSLASHEQVISKSLIHEGGKSFVSH